MRVRTLLLVGCLILGACGGDTDAARPLSQEEAARLAETTFLNHRAGSTAFEVATLTAPGGGRLGLAGTADWSTSSGAARVLTDDGANTLVAVSWGSDVIAERRPVHDGFTGGLGLPAGAWFSRPVDTRRRVDQVLAVVMGLATKRPENAVLIQQEEGSAFLRGDTLRGRDVQVLRYGKRSIYWVDVETGRMLRFEGNNSAASLPIVVDFLPQGDTDMVAPDAADVVPLASYPELAALFAGP